MVSVTFRCDKLIAKKTQRNVSQKGVEPSEQLQHLGLNAILPKDIPSNDDSAQIVHSA